MRKNSTEFSNFKRFMAKMENEKKQRELLYKNTKRAKSGDKNGRKTKNARDDNQ